MKQLHLYISNDEPEPQKDKRAFDTSLGSPSPEMGYDKYLQSQEWHNKRKYAIYKAGHRCQKCGRSPKILQVHHKHYDTLYRERLEDIEVLCVPCHRMADGDREYCSAFETWAYKVYGEYWYDYDEERLREEFDDWLKEKENDYW